MGFMLISQNNISIYIKYVLDDDFKSFHNFKHVSRMGFY